MQRNLNDGAVDEFAPMTLAQAAVALGVSTFTLRRWIKRGKLQTVRIGLKICISRAVVSQIQQKGISL